MKETAKILIGYDGSACAEAALDDLLRAGLPETAAALVLSVTEAALPSPPPSSYQILEQARAVHVPADLKRVYAINSPALKQAQAHSDLAALRLRNNFPAWKVSADALVGSPAWELVAKADEWTADLIVVGSHGHSALGRFVLGSVSQRVLTEARCSVRVARGRLEEPDTPVRMIVGIDGSPGSKAALREVASRHWPARSELRVIAVNDPMMPTFIGEFVPPVAQIIADSNRADREELQKILTSSAAELRSSPLKVSTEILEGSAKRVLVETAEAWGADCIFVGSLGFSNRFERFVLGSVSAAVAARAHCSVEVVRPFKGIGGNNYERESKSTHN